MTAHLVNLASGWRGGFVALMILAWQSGGVVAQTSASRPAPSGWPVYQASRAATGYSATPYYPSAQSGYRAPAYSSPQNSFQNPLRGAELRGLWHQPQEYPYSSSRLYPYYNSYLYPYNYGDARIVPGMDTIGSGSGGQTMEEAAPSPATTASVEVRLPTAQAEVIFNGVITKTTGTVRSYTTPKLVTDRDYFYNVMARWADDGKEVRRERRVSVSAGQHVVIDFTKPRSSSGTNK
jgi:uncharacterized protein (TIGR03000 family)